ncbi:286_t:CDS:2, partial [Gigaspora rosea]
IGTFTSFWFIVATLFIARRYSYFSWLISRCYGYVGWCSDFWYRHVVVSDSHFSLLISRFCGCVYYQSPFLVSLCHSLVLLVLTFPLFFA